MSPEDAGWLQDHLLFSEGLRAAGGSSPENKDRARESMLSGLVKSAPPLRLRTRLRFAFAIAQTALMIFGCLALTAGAAAAADLNFRSVPRHVVDKLVEPLSPLAENLKGSLVLAPEGEAAAADSGGGGRLDNQSGTDRAVEDAAVALSRVSDVNAPTDVSAPTNVDLPVQDDASSHSNQPGNDAPRGNPAETEHPDNGRDRQGSGGHPPDNGNPPGERSNGGASNGGSGSNGGGPDGGGSNGGASSGAHGDASNKASTHH